MIFDAGEDEADEKAPPVSLPRGKQTARAGAIRQTKTPARPQSKPAPKAQAQSKPAAQVIDEREARIRYRAEEAAPSLANLLILASTVLVGSAVAPNHELAEDISKPALRILMRHFPALLELSPDAADGVELITAVGIYANQIAPVMRAQRGDRRVTRGQVNRGYPSGSANGYYPVPAAPVQPERPATPAGYGQNAAGDLHSGGVENGYTDSGARASRETSVFAELGIQL